MIFSSSADYHIGVFMLIEEKKRFFKELLTQRLEELTAEANKSVGSISDLNEKYYDLVDQAMVEADIDFSVRLRERQGKLIDKIKSALERLDQGIYGICEECGEEIGEKRLEARPVTTLCINCKKKQEADEKLRGL
jgi:DnaK suppressor protein